MVIEPGVTQLLVGWSDGDKAALARAYAVSLRQTAPARCCLKTL